MSEEIGAVYVCNCEECREWNFWELFFEAVLLKGTLYVSKDVVSKVGFLNGKLKEKQIYEWLLRIAAEYGVLCINQKVCEEWKAEQLLNDTEWIKFLIEEDEERCSGVETECYVTGRYKKQLLEANLFDAAVQRILICGNEMTQGCLEKMLVESREYREIYDATQPILIYSGLDVCHGILDYFAKEFGEALSKKGERIEYFDVSKQDFKEIADYADRRWKAVIGVQTYMFSVKKDDGTFIHDQIEAPLFHLAFDHPIRMRGHLEKVPKRMKILTLDANYVTFIKECYGHEAVFFPPAGVERKIKPIEIKNRKYEISFLGKCSDILAENLFLLKAEDRTKAKFANVFLKYLKKDINGTPEQAMRHAMQEYGMETASEQLLECLSEYRWMIGGIADYYRRKIVEILLKAGFELHVYGDSWKDSPLKKYENLILHDTRIGEEALEVYAQTKISLNVMTWHKAGFTERIANAMLQKSVVLTDRTTYLEENFINGQELVMFDLTEISCLPQKVKELLENTDRLESISNQGYAKAKELHTWDARAERFLKDFL